jgi:hypothetical protein
MIVETVVGSESGSNDGRDTAKWAFGCAFALPMIRG